MAEVLLGDVPERNAARLGADRWAVRHGEDVLSWGELAERALRRAHALAGQGVAQGDRVVLALPNANAFYEWTFALWKLGATPTVVSPRLPAAELVAIVALAEPRAVVAADPALRSALGALPEDFGRDHAERAPLASKVAPHWKAMTSGGSTGRPKLIVDALPSRIDDGFRGLGMPADGVMLNPAPLYHNFPFAMTHMMMLHGTSVVGMAKFDAEEFLALVERHRVQWVSLVPTMMQRIARLPEALRRAHDLSSLETVWHTAAPIPAALKQFWIDWLGPERIWEMYGGTEGFCTTQLNGTEWLAHRGSVGRPAGGELLIRGEDGAALPPGEIGEIFMRRAGASAPSYAYVGAESRRLDDGFESLGDHGWVDDDGYLYIADRRTDLIVSGGHNVYPAEVEGALLEHPAVAEAVVIGLPDDDLGARVHAVVRLEEGANTDTAALLAFAAERLVAYKLPRAVEFTDAPLRDEAGKVRRGKLREDRS
ncbi:AMP-binding protein [Novosphingobium sp. JCM 18896]|uniref:AMP-binding protein n=1 Tax=Novosphingobium sp. JCM 18896 TaxID=2989731 RepID=UPI00222261F3|nr:AMP-binding protein [Novosphingobium sp. JCM 18896]MCW1431873.1 AMP-binding protein [Novosphingobium sp. JCM 18896]